MIKIGATIKYEGTEGDSFYTYLGPADGAGRKTLLAGKTLLVYRANSTGQLYFREVGNFHEQMKLVCNHDTKLGNSRTGTITCADCKQALS